MNFKDRFERFHDNNRYFLPLIFISFILMVTGAFFIGPVILNYDVIVNRTLLFDSSSVIQAVTIKPGWTFYINVLANKPVKLSLFNLGGEVVASSDNNTLLYSPEFLDLYFVRVTGSNYAILDFNYYKTGLEPYPIPYLFFGSGLILFLGVLIYYLLEPWGFKLKRKLDRIDAFFYPVVFLLSSIIFWVFRDSLIWFIPKSSFNSLLLIVVPIILLVVLTIVSFVKMNNFSKSLVGYAIAYSAVFLSVILDYSGWSGYLNLLVNSLIICLMIFLFVRFNQRVPVIVFSLTWFTGVMLRLMAYSIGIPVIFDLFLSSPVTGYGTIVLLFVIELFLVLGVYFLVRGYYSKDKAQAINFGLYAGVCVQAFLQIFSGTSLL